MFRKCAVSIGLALAIVSGARADAVYQSLPFYEDWTQIGRIAVDDDWSGVPGILGFRGDGLTSTAGIDAWTVRAPGTNSPIDVIANKTNPGGLASAGVAEFHLADPVVGLQASGTADAPFLLLHLNATDWQGIRVQYRLRDLDGSADDAFQQVVLQYRIGESGDFSNVAGGFVADATSGPALLGQDMLVSAVLPDAVEDQSRIQLRILTTNAVGNDEWVGIDDIRVSGNPVSRVAGPLPVASPTPGAVPEPGVLSLLGVALCLAGLQSRRRMAAQH